MGDSHSDLQKALADYHDSGHSSTELEKLLTVVTTKADFQRLPSEWFGCKENTVRGSVFRFKLWRHRGSGEHKEKLVRGAVARHKWLRDLWAQEHPWRPTALDCNLSSAALHRMEQKFPDGPANVDSEGKQRALRQSLRLLMDKGTIERLLAKTSRGKAKAGPTDQQKQRLQEQIQAFNDRRQELQEVLNEATKGSDDAKTRAKVMINDLNQHVPTNWRLDPAVVDPVAAQTRLQELSADMGKHFQAAAAEGLGNYDSDDSLLTRIQGGAAMQAVRLWLDPLQPMASTHEPFLEAVRDCHLLGPVASSTLSSMAFETSESSSAFKQAVETSGWSAAAKVTVDMLVVSGSASYEGGGQQQQNTVERSMRQTQVAYTVLCASVATGSFRMPRSSMVPSAAAVREAKEVRSADSARAYLRRFGSHVCGGLQQVGGSMIYSVETRSQEAKKLHEHQEAAAWSHTASAEIGGQKLFTTVKAAVSGGAEGSNSKAQGRDDFLRSFSSQSTLTVRGPLTSTNFAADLTANSKYWHIIDRGDPEHFVGVWEVLMDLVRDDLPRLFPTPGQQASPSNKMERLKAELEALLKQDESKCQLAEGAAWIAAAWVEGSTHVGKECTRVRDLLVGSVAHLFDSLPERFTGPRTHYNKVMTSTSAGGDRGEGDCVASPENASAKTLTSEVFIPIDGPQDSRSSATTTTIPC